MKIRIEVLRATLLFNPTLVISCPDCGHDDFHAPLGAHFTPGTLTDAYHRAEQMYFDHLSYHPDGARCPVGALITLGITEWL